MSTNSPRIILGKNKNHVNMFNIIWPSTWHAFLAPQHSEIDKTKRNCEAQLLHAPNSFTIRTCINFILKPCNNKLKLTYPGHHLWRDNHGQVSWHSVFHSVLSTDPVMAPIIQHRGVSGKLVKTNLRLV